MARSIVAKVKKMMFQQENNLKHDLANLKKILLRLWYGMIHYQSLISYIIFEVISQQITKAWGAA